MNSSSSSRFVGVGVGGDEGGGGVWLRFWSLGARSWGGPL